jgi:CubicO group peptidase (beta-lactamase class C family)
VRQNDPLANQSTRPARRHEAARRGWIAHTQQTVSELFSGRVADNLVPSACVAVFDSAGIVYADGFGNIPATGEAPTPDTAYRIASCTKSFTAALLLIMRDRGLLRLADSIADWLDVGPLTGPDGRSVRSPTLAELASMSAGLPTDDPWADRQEPISTAAFDELVAGGLRFVAEPGQRYEYSNLGYALLGRCLQQVTGCSWQQLVSTELLGPLRLTGIGAEAGLHADAVAPGQHKIDNHWVKLEPISPGAFSAIGGLYATVRSLVDWCHWLAVAFDEGANVPIGDASDPLLTLMSTSVRKFRPVTPGSNFRTEPRPSAAGPLPAGSRMEMQTCHSPPASGTGDDRAGYGYGLQIWQHPRHGRIVHHSGGYPGYGSHMRWHLESGIGIVALENATYSGPSRPAAEALESILDAVLPAAEPQLWPETVAARLSVERLIREWDPQIAGDLFADNVDLDEPLARRRAAIAGLVAVVGPLNDQPLPLTQAAPVSTGPSRLAWTVPGRNGLLRCQISLTPQNQPRVQTLVVRRS